MSTILLINRKNTKGLKNGETENRREKEIKKKKRGNQKKKEIIEEKKKKKIGSRKGYEKNV